jgi:hypothetical protein
MHQSLVEQLWQLLDDIDTLGDQLKPERTLYFERVNELVAKRHQLLKSDGYKLYWPAGQVACTITGHDESREIVPQRDEEGTVVGLTPVGGSERVFLHLTLPNGQGVKAQVSLADFDQHIIPFMARTGDDFPLAG